MTDRDRTQRPRLVVDGGDALSDRQIESLAGWLLDLLSTVERAQTNDTTKPQPAADSTRPPLSVVRCDGSVGMGMEDHEAGPV